MAGSRAAPASLAAFGPDQRARIEAAVAAAERRTSAEIVVCVTDRSAEYPEVGWQGAALGGLAALAAATCWWSLRDWGVVVPAWWAALPPLLGALVGWIGAVTVPGIRRRLAGAQRLEAAVWRRAAVGFRDEEVFATRDRTGLLVFLSLFERRCVVLPDRGVAEQVGNDEWRQMADHVAAGMRDGDPVRALVAVVERFGALLEERGLARRRDDEDELPDQVRLEPTP